MDPDAMDLTPQANPEPLLSLEVWRMALTQPNEETFRRIRDDPAASLARAIGWIALSSGIAYAIGAIVQLLFIQVLPISSFMEGAQEIMSGRLLAGISSLFILVCGLPITIVISVTGTLALAGLIHFIAGALGGTGSYRQLVYAFAAISAPFSIASALLGLIPIINCLTVPLALYIVMLNILAIKVVHRLSWGAALGAAAILLMVFMLLAVVLGLALWNPLQDFLRSPEFLPSESY